MTWYHGGVSLAAYSSRQTVDSLVHASSAHTTELLCTSFPGPVGHSYLFIFSGFWFGFGENLPFQFDFSIPASASWPVQATRAEICAWDLCCQRFSAVAAAECDRLMCCSFCCIRCVEVIGVCVRVWCDKVRSPLISLVQSYTSLRPSCLRRPLLAKWRACWSQKTKKNLNGR